MAGRLEASQETQAALLALTSPVGAEPAPISSGSWSIQSSTDQVRARPDGNELHSRRPHLLIKGLAIVDSTDHLKMKSGHDRKIMVIGEQTPNRAKLQPSHLVNFVIGTELARLLGHCPVSDSLRSTLAAAIPRLWQRHTEPTPQTRLLMNLTQCALQDGFLATRPTRTWQGAQSPAQAGMRASRSSLHWSIVIGPAPQRSSVIVCRPSPS